MNKKTLLLEFVTKIKPISAWPDFWEIKTNHSLRHDTSGKTDIEFALELRDMLIALGVTDVKFEYPNIILTRYNGATARQRRALDTIMRTKTHYDAWQSPQKTR